MLKAVEGVYKHGKIELSEVPPDIVQSRVIVTFLEATSEITPQMMYFGMFAAANQSTEKDFQIAEFHSGIDDGLNWS